MADLVVVVPSRGRPQAVTELAKAFNDTCLAYGDGTPTKLLFVVDADDPTVPDYRSAAQEQRHWINTAIIEQPTGTMVSALNFAALAQSTHDVPPFAIGFMGDDHRPRTEGWDVEYLDALDELGTGIVYGDDLYQGEKLPTQCAMTSDIIRTLGYMAPPGLVHMYVDNFWMDLGTEADCLFYLPEVVVEHVHPVAGKADWDEGHKRVNAPEIFDADALAYGDYHRDRFAADVSKVRSLLSVAV